VAIQQPEAWEFPSICGQKASARKGIPLSLLQRLWEILFVAARHALQLQINGHGILPLPKTYYIKPITSPALYPLRSANYRPDVNFEPSKQLISHSVGTEK
jgi:hypothetical protein